MHIKKVDFLTLVGTKFLDNVQCVIYYLAKKKRPYLDKKHFIDQNSTIDHLKQLLILGVTFLGGNDSCYSP